MFISLLTLARYIHMKKRLDSLVLKHRSTSSSSSWFLLLLFFLWCDTSRIGDPLLWEFNFSNEQRWLSFSWLVWLSRMTWTVHGLFVRSPDLFLYIFFFLFHHHHLPHIIKIQITFFFVVVADLFGCSCVRRLMKKQNFREARQLRKERNTEKRAPCNRRE